MGSYISALCMNINKRIYNENQYATLITFDRKVCIYFVAKVKWFKVKRRDIHYDFSMITSCTFFSKDW